MVVLEEVVDRQMILVLVVVILADKLVLPEIYHLSVLHKEMMVQLKV